jgi:hypothetical protein
MGFLIPPSSPPRGSGLDRLGQPWLALGRVGDFTMSDEKGRVPFRKAHKTDIFLEAQPLKTVVASRESAANSRRQSRGFLTKAASPCLQRFSLASPLEECRKMRPARRRTLRPRTVALPKRERTSPNVMSRSNPRTFSEFVNALAHLRGF